jgi:predicted nucleic acid-binding protein
MSAVYVDASALVKLVIREAETSTLEGWLSGKSVVSSTIATVEVTRGVRRSGADGGGRMRDVLDRIITIACDGEVLSVAAALEPAGLRTLDALHLASALRLGPELDSFVTYDRRQSEAAVLAGLAVESPGTP